MRFLKFFISPAARCIYAILLCVGVSFAGSDASRTFILREKTKFAAAKTVFPIQMRRWDEELFNSLIARNKADMAEFLKGADQDAASKAQGGDISDVKPYDQTVQYIDQFRGMSYVSYLEVSTVSWAGGEPSITFRTINYDNKTQQELTLTDLLDNAADRSPALEALAAYARADLSDQINEEAESEALFELTKPDLSVYRRFTFCPSTKIGKAAGITIHFTPNANGLYPGSSFRVTIPYSVFSKYLKPGMKGLFGGEPRQSPVDLREAG